MLSLAISIIEFNIITFIYVSMYRHCSYVHNLRHIIPIFYSTLYQSFGKISLCSNCNQIVEIYLKRFNKREFQTKLSYIQRLTICFQEKGKKLKEF